MSILHAHYQTRAWDAVAAELRATVAQAHLKLESPGKPSVEYALLQGEIRLARRLLAAAESTAPVSTAGDPSYEA